MSRRAITGIAIFAATFAAAIAILAFATAWTPIGAPLCFRDIAHSQFPKWLGCALAVHETLASGLIAAGGALFGAWLAFSGLQDQIGLARKNELEAKRLEYEKQTNDTARDLDLMRTAHGYVKAVADVFPQPSDPALPTGEIARRILELRRRGGLKISLNAARAPDGNGESVTTAIGRLNAFADNLHEETKELAAEVRAGMLRSVDHEALQHIDALRQLADILSAKIPRYEQKFKDAAARTKLLEEQATTTMVVG